MEQSNPESPPPTPDGIVTEHVKFWNTATWFMARVAVGLAVALALLWFFLVR